MFITINNEEIEVAVSEGGMFYDKATSKFTAKTLAGLTKKLRTQATPANGVPVEHWESGKRGVVTGRVQTRGWRRSYFVVRWDDGTTSDEGSNNLCPHVDSNVRVQKIVLDNALEEARNAQNEAYSAVSSYRDQYRLNVDLNSIFPEMK